jgi:transposase InsO family protein
MPHRPTCGPPCWMRASTSDRSRRFTACCAKPAKPGNGAAKPATPPESNPNWPRPRRTRCGRPDITKLHGPAKWTYYHLYVILDIFSRYVVGWMVAHRESAALAEVLIRQTCTKQGISRDQLTIHADRGSSMTSKPVALLLADLGITQSHSRPRVCDDNPFSEAQFKTLKYRPDFPGHFTSIEAARTHCQLFSPGITINIDTAAWAYTPPPTFTTAPLPKSVPNAASYSPPPTTPTPNASSTNHPNHPPYQPARGSTHPTRHRPPLSNYYSTVPHSG